MKPINDYVDEIRTPEFPTPPAKRQCNRFASVGLSAYDILPWNAYPWYTDRAPKAAELMPRNTR